MELITEWLWFVFPGVNGAVNGSGVCPPTTQSGSFSSSPAPVQASTKPTKNPDHSNSHRSSPQNNPAEMVEKPVQKTKEKVSTETDFTPHFEKGRHVKCSSHELYSEADSCSFSSRLRNHERSQQTLVGAATVNQAHPQTAQVTGPSAVIWRTWQRMMRTMMMMTRMTKTRTNCQTQRSGQRKNQR